MSTTATPDLIVWTSEPLNAETPLGALCRAEVTPTELFFVRTHGTVPALDPDAYRLSVGGMVGRPLSLSLGDLRELFPPATVTATLACAGNRRAELGRHAPVADAAVPWGAGAIGNAAWTGVRLGDLLRAAGVAPGAEHVAFTGLDEVEADGRPEEFGGSVPIGKALAPEVLLAYEMNGRPLAPEHGFPLRAIVPGYIGARSVKWLGRVAVQATPSASFFHATDYTLGGVPLGELPLNAAFAPPDEGTDPSGPTTVVRGYAMAGGPRRVDRVEVSADGGRTWRPATLAGDSEPWAWRLWRAEVEVAGAGELVVRAWDSSGAGQPESLAEVWNARGYMNNAWQRVRVRT